jgi:hypothetical protein
MMAMRILSFDRWSINVEKRNAKRWEIGKTNAKEIDGGFGRTGMG